jgi:ribosomal protein S17E
MATLPRNLTLAALMLVGALTAGCQLMALPYFFLPGMDPKREAECPLACTTDKEKTVRVVILSQSSLETRPEFLRIDRDLAQMLAQSMAVSFKKNKEKVTMVANSQVEKYKDEHPNWKAMGPAEIGKSFKADYVVGVEVNQISLYESGSSNTLFKGRCDISLVVTDVQKYSEGPKYTEEITVEFPKARGPIDATNGNVAQFRQKFLSVIARELAARFSERLIEDDYKCE